MEVFDENGTLRLKIDDLEMLKELINAGLIDEFRDKEVSTSSSNCINRKNKSNVSPVELFVQDYVCRDHSQNIISILSNDFYREFVSWKDLNFPKFNLDAQNFGVKLIGIQGISKDDKRTSKGHNRILDIKKIKEYYGIIDLETEQ